MPSFLLLQTGDYLLLQTGDRLLLQRGDINPGASAGAGPSRKRRNRIKEEDDEVMRIVDAILSRIEQ